MTLPSSDPADGGAHLVAGDRMGVPDAMSPEGAARRGLPPRGTIGLLGDPVFGPFFCGKLLSMAGVWVFNIVAAIIVWDMSRSTLVVGAVSAALFLPQLLFAPLSGAHADRGNPKVQLLVGRMLIVGASALLAMATGLSGVQGLPGPWFVILAAALVGCGFVVGGPAQHSVLPSLVRPSELSNAVALNTLPPTVARAGGPVLGSLLYFSAGPAWAFAATSITNLGFGLVLAMLPLADRVARAEPDGGVRAGFAYLRRDRDVTFLLVGMLAVGLGSDPVITLTPALSAEFARGEALVGVFATAFGAGAALAYFAVTPIQQYRGERVLTGWGLALLGFGLLVTGIAPSPSVAIAGLAASGVGFCWALTGGTTRLYQRVPDTLRGRIMALWSITFIGSRPLGATASGALADAISVRVAFLAVFGFVALLGLASHLGVSGRHLSADLR